MKVRVGLGVRVVKQSRQHRQTAQAYFRNTITKSRNISLHFGRTDGFKQNQKLWIFRNKSVQGRTSTANMFAERLITYLHSVVKASTI